MRSLDEALIAEEGIPRLSHDMVAKTHSPLLALQAFDFGSDAFDAFESYENISQLEWEIAHDELKYGDMVGRGSFGTTVHI